MMSTQHMLIVRYSMKVIDSRPKSPAKVSMSRDTQSLKCEYCNWHMRLFNSNNKNVCDTPQFICK